MRRVFAFVGVLFLVGILSFPQASYAKSFTFFVAHRPDNAEHLKLIQQFSKQVESRTGGSLKINVVAAKDERRGLRTAVPMVYSNEYQMSQVPISRFRQFSDDLDVLETPGLIRSHEHAAAVFDGEVGAELRETVKIGSNGVVRGLAFTYSGGWKHLYSSRSVGGLEDIHAATTMFRRARVGVDTMHFMGLKQMNFTPEDYWSNHSKAHIVEEAETNRIHILRGLHSDFHENVKTVLKTRHSLYITMVTINGAAMDSLSAKERKVLSEEVQTFAHKERLLSIDLAARNEAKLKQEGLKFIHLSKTDQKQLAKIANRVQKNIAHAGLVGLRKSRRLVIELI